MAGILSCLPNVGMAFGRNVISSAEILGVSHASSGNTVWALLFTFGFVANVAYCLYLMITKDTLSQYWNQGDAAQSGVERVNGLDVDWKLLSLRSGRGKARTLGCSGGLAAVYLALHRRGKSLGFMARRVEGCPQPARRLLNLGLLVLIVAVITVALSNSF